MPLRLAHLSDPHFSSLTFSPNQFLSKRWLGNLNLALFRRSALKMPHLLELPTLIDDLKLDTVLITGDFTSTSLESEYEKALSFTQGFTDKVYTLPGNHDVYTKKAEKEKIFYRYFPCKDLEVKRVAKDFLKQGWWLVRIDCARANNFIQSNGIFYPEMESALEETLDSIPKTDRVILANHFPLFPSGRASHDTERAYALQNILLAHPSVKLYLHGHDHDPYIIDCQDEGYPLVLNSGSCAHSPGGTFYIITAEKDSCLIERYLFSQKEGVAIIDLQMRYSF